MTSEELFNMRAAMFRYGGSFIKSLAVTLGHADEINCRRLLHAFPGVIIKYGPDSFFSLFVSNLRFVILCYFVYVFNNFHFLQSSYIIIIINANCYSTIFSLI